MNLTQKFSPIKRYLPNHRRSNRRHLCSALRSFLNYRTVLATLLRETFSGVLPKRIQHAIK